MTAALHPPPRRATVLREQIAVVGLALRGPSLVLGALLLVATIGIASAVARTGEGLDFRPEHQLLPGVLGFLLPMAVWRGEPRFGGGFLWTLPVDRREHALARVFAGWTWLMAAIAAFVAWQLAFTLATGGGILTEETLRVLQPGAPVGGVIGEDAFRSVRWTPRPVFWLVPFTAATGTYLLASALTLAVRHPARWVAGAVLAAVLLAGGVETLNAERLADLAEPVLRELFDGRFGIDVLLTARTESLKVHAYLAPHSPVVVWRALPSVGDWAVATLLWTGAGLAALWAAASRHRERRRR